MNCCVCNINLPKKDYIKIFYYILCSENCKNKILTEEQVNILKIIEKKLKKHVEVEKHQCMSKL